MNFLKSSLIILVVGIIAYNYFKRERPAPLSTVKIKVEKGWEKVGDKFKELIVNGEILGSSISIRHKGKEVVNIVGGYADRDALFEWDFNTLSIMFSSSKIYAATVILHMVDKKLLSLDDKITKFWPEFGKNGKENTTVSDMLTHRACLFSVDKDYDPVDLIENPRAVETIFENQTPHCVIGKDLGYHTLTYGVLLGILARKVDPKGRNLSEYFRDEIAIPNGLDTYIGLPYEENYRATKIGRMPKFSPEIFRSDALHYYRLTFYLVFPYDSYARRSLAHPSSYFGDYTVNNPIKRRAPDACCLGHSTASSMSKFLHLVQSGKILSKELVDSITKPIVDGYNLVIGENWKLSYGFYLINIKGREFYGHAGAGGQSLYADKENDMVFAYLTNYPTLFSKGDDPRFVQLFESAYDCLEKLNK